MATGNNQVVIENPVINSPFAEPQRHFRFSDEGISNEIVAQRRESAYFIPIPYTLNGEEHNYYPDFIVRIDDGHGPADLLNLILECTGQKKKDKEAKVTTAQTLWIPAVNGHGEFGRWRFLEIRDPWDAKNEIRSRRIGGWYEPQLPG